MIEETQPSERRLRHAIAERLATGRETVAQLAKDYGMTNRKIVAAVAWAWRDNEQRLERIAELVAPCNLDGRPVVEAVERVIAKLDSLIRMDDEARKYAEEDAARWKRTLDNLAAQVDQEVVE